MVTKIRLDEIEAAALDVVARHEGVSPERLLRDLIRDAAVRLVTGRRRREAGRLDVIVCIPSDDD